MRIVSWRVVAIALVAALLGGCATVQNTLRREDVASFKLVGVNVSSPPEAVLNWHDGIRAYAAAKNVPDHELATVTNTDDAKTYVRGLLAAKIKEAMERHLGGALIGSRPVRLEVVVRNLEISTAVQRILIGGSYNMIADVNLVDAKTGSVIIGYPALVYVQAAGQGVLGTVVQAAYDASTSPPIDRVVNGHAELYRNWLLPR